MGEQAPPPQVIVKWRDALRQRTNDLFSAAFEKGCSLVPQMKLLTLIPKVVGGAQERVASPMHEERRSSRRYRVVQSIVRVGRLLLVKRMHQPGRFSSINWASRPSPSREFLSR